MVIKAEWGDKTCPISKASHDWNEKKKILDSFVYIVCHIMPSSWLVFGRQMEKSHKG